MTVLLDIAPETAVARKRSGRDRYERDMALLARVRQSYRRQARRVRLGRHRRGASKDEVAAAVAQAVESRLAPPSAPAHS